VISVPQLMQMTNSQSNKLAVLPLSEISFESLRSPIVSVKKLADMRTVNASNLVIFGW